MQLDTGIGCVCPISKSWKPGSETAEQYVVKGLKVAQTLGAHSMRCFMGSRDDRRSGRPIEEYIEATVKVFRSVRSQAMDLGVKIAIENHAGDMQARETRMLIEEAGKDFVGSNLDCGNPIQAIEDPQVTLEILGPYVVTTHIATPLSTNIRAGQRTIGWRWATASSIGTSSSPLISNCVPKPRCNSRSSPGRPPEVIPYLEEDFWKISQDSGVGVCALRGAGEIGASVRGTMIMEDVSGKKPPEYTAALKEQQRVDLERSLAFAKKLGSLR